MDTKQKKQMNLLTAIEQIVKKSSKKEIAMKKETVLDLFRKFDFGSILPHLDHLFVVNSKHHLSDASIKVFRSIYNHWANECETKPTDYHIRLASRWEYTCPFIDMNCSVYSGDNLFYYSVAGREDMIEVLSMEVRVEDWVEISEVELAAGLFWEMTYYGPKENG